MTSPWSDFFQTAPINPSSINGAIELPMQFSLLTGAAVVLTSAVTVYRWSRGADLRTSLQHALVAAFISLGLLWALQGDLLWKSWVTEDIRKFAGKETRAKSFVQDGTVFFVAEMVKKILAGNDYRLYVDWSGNNTLQYQAKKLQYYLLPLRNRDSAEYALVMFDRTVSYDPVSKVFQDRSKNRLPAEHCLQVADNFYLVRIMP